MPQTNLLQPAGSGRDRFDKARAIRTLRKKGSKRAPKNRDREEEGVFGWLHVEKYPSLALCSS